MKASGAIILMGTLLVTTGALTAWPQEAPMSGGTHSVGITGKVTQDKAPAPNLQVVFTNPQTNKQYKAKTDKRGEYVSMGMMPDSGSTRATTRRARGAIPDKRWPKLSSSPAASDAT